MGRETGIAWTDATFNPWWGCTEVTPGCDNCYARELDARFGGDHWGKGKARKMMSDKHWGQLRKWDEEARCLGEKLKVFTMSMGDIMDDEAPEGQLQRLYDLIDQCPNLIFQFLTKRPHRYATMLPQGGFKHCNVWLGTTCENQNFFDIRWPIVANVCARYGLVGWVSYEPALGPLSLRNSPYGPDWIIFGGETGADDKRRPVEVQWAHDLKEECERLDFKFFMKQLGGRNPAAAKALIPADLLIHQFPGGA